MKKKSLTGWIEDLDFSLIGRKHSKYHLFMPFVYENQKEVKKFYSKLVKVRITIEEIK